MDIPKYSHRIGLVIGRNKGGSGLQTLMNLDKAMEEVTSGLETIGFEKDEIFELKNNTNAEMID